MHLSYEAVWEVLWKEDPWALPKEYQEALEALMSKSRKDNDAASSSGEPSKP
ncbi:hypothetical protein A2U01_0001401 [Trifolium medium]|uniref:Uncharacterized protein n=1 Tax=Trifolium medium TaxID=97028 RepID=A0A392M061_9FABA|nr:hypothetical protein [Trifolium medium]